MLEDEFLPLFNDVPGGVAAFIIDWAARAPFFRSADLGTDDDLGESCDFR